MSMQESVFERKRERERKWERHHFGVKMFSQGHGEATAMNEQNRHFQPLRLKLVGLQL